MGCDVHLCIEYRPAYTRSKNSRGIWFSWAKDVSQARNYTMFGYIAGVRSHQSMIHPIVEPRGLPKDVTEETQAEHTYVGGHSTTWLYPEEFMAVYAMCLMEMEDDGSTLSSEWKVVKDVLKVLQKRYGNENVRAIFFFDS